jgi:hypothetical protein
VIVNDFGQDDDGEPLVEVKVIDPASEDHISLEAVWAHLEWCRLLREHGWNKKAKKTLLSNLRPSPDIEALWAGTTSAEEDAALEASLTATGPVFPITADERGNILDGHRCYGSVANNSEQSPKSTFVWALFDSRVSVRAT